MFVFIFHLKSRPSLHSEVRKTDITKQNTIWFQVSCGLNHTLVLSLDGMAVWAFGDGDYGKLGAGSSTAKYYPQVSNFNITS